LSGMMRVGRKSSEAEKKGSRMNRLALQLFRCRSQNEFVDVQGPYLGMGSSPREPARPHLPNEFGIPTSSPTPQKTFKTRFVTIRRLKSRKRTQQLTACDATLGSVQSLVQQRSGDIMISVALGLVYLAAERRALSRDIGVAGY